MNVDGSSSTDPDGTIASYAWDFGDGATATGANRRTPTPRPGTYPITLTVTDNKGTSTSLTKPVETAAGGERGAGGAVHQHAPRT